VRGVEDYEFGFVGETVAEAVEIEGEAAFFDERDRHGLRADEVDHRFVNREAGVGVDYLVAGFEEREHREKDDGFAAGDNADVFRADADSTRLADVGGYGFAQFGEALGWAVVGPALIESLFAGFDDVFGGA
jgi:hypothetical protein